MQYAAMNRKYQQVKSYKLYIYIYPICFWGCFGYVIYTHIRVDCTRWFLWHLNDDLSLQSAGMILQVDTCGMIFKPCGIPNESQWNQHKRAPFLHFSVFYISLFQRRESDVGFFCFVQNRGKKQNALSHQPNSRWRWPWIGGKTNHNPPYSDTHRMGPSSYVCWFITPSKYSYKML